MEILEEEHEKKSAPESASDGGIGPETQQGAIENRGGQANSTLCGDGGGSEEREGNAEQLSQHLRSGSEKTPRVHFCQDAQISQVGTGDSLAGRLSFRVAIRERRITAEMDCVA